MEKSKLSPELQSMMDQFTKFRKEYLALKTNYSAQEELIELQKIELQKMNAHVENLTCALMDYQKRFNSTFQHMESENQRLQKVIDDTKRAYENSRDYDNEFDREIQRNNDEYIHRLEIDLEALRAEAISQEEKHREQIKSIEERHRNEISVYDEKIERINSLEKRYKDEIDACKKKLENLNSIEKRHRASVPENIQNVGHSALPELTAKNNYSENPHPALGSCTQNTGNKRKKNAAASHKWPQLDISVKKEKENAQKSVQRKKKKLFLAVNDDVVVDLAS